MLDEAAMASQYQEEADRMPGDWDWADPVVTQYLKRAVKKRAAFKVAESLEGQGQFDEALRRLGPVAEEFPDDIEYARMFAHAWDRLADIHTDRREWARSITMCEAALDARAGGGQALPRARTGFRVGKHPHAPPPGPGPRPPGRRRHRRSGAVDQCSWGSAGG